MNEWITLFYFALSIKNVFLYVFVLKCILVNLKMTLWLQYSLAPEFLSQPAEFPLSSGPQLSTYS